MAGDWIKVQTCTPDKPEVHLIAERLGIDPDAVTGKLIRIWCWADQQTIDGNARSVTKTLLDRVTGVTGFAEMLLEVGWLAKTEGGFSFPNFDRHNGNSAKTRASVAKRVEKHRKAPEAANRKCNAETVTTALPEKRREESNSIDGRPAEHTIPTSLDDAECHAAAERWFDYLDSKNLQDKSPRGNEIQLQSWWQFMAKLGRDGFLEAVTQSIAAGRWNVELKTQAPSRNGKAKSDESAEWIKCLNAARSYPTDYETRLRILGTELFEALKRTGTARVSSANDFELKTLSASFAEHLKDVRSGTKVSN